MRKGKVFKDLNDFMGFKGSMWGQSPDVYKLANVANVGMLPITNVAISQCCTFQLGIGN